MHDLYQAMPSGIAQLLNYQARLQALRFLQFETISAYQL